MQGQLFNSETKSQEQAILQYLQAGRVLTQLEALNLFRCMRLGARVHSLRKQGHKIQSEMVKVPSGKHVAQYRMEGQ